MKSATANDVARLAGVSRSAVSRTFSGKGFVSSEKRERIVKAAQQLNYRPNAIASSLASKQSNLVAIVINKRPDDRSPFFYNALWNAVQEMGYVPLLVPVVPSEDGIVSLRQTITYPLRGVIVMADSVSPVAVQNIATETRPVMLNHHWSGEDEVDAVIIDQRSGIDEMVADLAATRHRTIGFIGGRLTAENADERRNALIDAMVRHGLTLTAEGQGDFSYDRGYAETRRMFASGELPDALFCANDITAFAALDALRLELGRKVPEDISVVGYDDTPSAHWGAYNLSTIREHAEQIIALITTLLTEPSAKPGQYRIETEYVRRGTVTPRR